MKLYSKPYDREFEVEICPPREGENADVQVIAHASLERIIVHELKVSYDTTVVVGGTSHSLVKCVMEDKNTGIRVCAHGETTKSTLTSEIGQGYPTRTAETRAFDAAAIILLGFEGKFYTDYQLSAESRVSVNVGTNANSEKADYVSPDTFVDDESYESEVVIIDDVDDDEASYRDLPDDFDDDTVDEVVDDEVTDEASTATDETGNYRLESSSKKGMTLREIYDSKDGKGWLDYYLGGNLGKMDIKKAIVEFYLANDIPGPNGEAAEDASKQQRENAVNGKNTFEKLAKEIKGE